MNVCEKIDKMLLDRGMSRRKLALNAGIPPTTFQSAMARGGNLSLDMLQKIADALGVKVTDLLALDPSSPKDKKLLDEVNKQGLVDGAAIEKEFDIDQKNIPADDDLDEDDKVIQKLLDQLSPENLDKAMDYIDLLLSSQEKE